MYAAFAYVYIFLYVLQLVRTNTSFARRAYYAYVYGLCTLSGLCVQIRLLRVKQLILYCLGDSFDIAMMFVNSFDAAMTVMLDIIRFI